MAETIKTSLIKSGQNFDATQCLWFVILDERETLSVQIDYKK